MEFVFRDVTGKPCYAITPSKKKATKKELAQIAKAAGEKYFYADCKRHGKGVEHLTSCMKCAICQRERAKQHYEENPDYKKQYCKANREALSEYRKQYRESNRDSISERMKKYYQDNRAFKVAMTTCQRMGLPQKGLKQRLPYSEEEFTAHIESLWQEGMDWGNYGCGEGCWSIDHIVPVEFFTRVGETDIAVINALDNLQPLWHTENNKKQNSIEIQQQREALHKYDNAVIF